MNELDSSLTGILPSANKEPKMKEQTPNSRQQTKSGIKRKMTEKSICDEETKLQKLALIKSMNMPQLGSMSKSQQSFQLLLVDSSSSETANSSKIIERELSTNSMQPKCKELFETFFTGQNFKDQDFFLIHENKRFRTSWDVFVILLSLWICFSLPFDIAFEPEGLKNQAYTIFNYLTDAIFLIDIVFNFRTTIQDFITGDEIIDSKQTHFKIIIIY